MNYNLWLGIHHVGLQCSCNFPAPLLKRVLSIEQLCFNIMSNLVYVAEAELGGGGEGIGAGVWVGRYTVELVILL